MDSPNPEITIEDVVESFSARLEAGDRPSIEEYKQNYPELADRIEAILPALVALENVESNTPDRKLAVDDSIPEVLGEYEIIQEVGRGGMGIVFEARHATMQRRVALKVLPKSCAQKANFVDRFLTEARSAGQLHHTNIVPVFEVGQTEGLHFYAMQFIQGENLDRVIDDIRMLRRNSRRVAVTKAYVDNKLPTQNSASLGKASHATLSKGQRRKVPESIQSETKRRIRFNAMKKRPRRQHLPSQRPPIQVPATRIIAESQRLAYKSRRRLTIPITTVFCIAT